MTLLFNGRGTSPNDVAALERIFREWCLRHEIAGSEKLGAMSDVERKAHRLLIVPGGDFEQIGNAHPGGHSGKASDDSD